MNRFLADTDFEAVVLRRIVTAGDHDAAVDRQVEERKVEQRRGTDADIDDIQPACQESLDEGIEEAWRTKPSVPADRDRLDRSILDVGAIRTADLIGNRVR